MILARKIKYFRFLLEVVPECLVLVLYTRHQLHSSCIVVRVSQSKMILAGRIRNSPITVSRSGGQGSFWAHCFVFKYVMVLTDDNGGDNGKMMNCYKLEA